MFDIHSVEMTNFRSYAGTHRFDLPTAPGLYYITGENKLEKRLEANGSGKSTILDAIYWCLYGCTIRGLLATNVVTWGRKGSSVTLQLTVGDKTFTVTRSHSPNSLTIDGTHVDQVTLQQHIVIGADAFLHSVIMPQFGQAFFELTPTNKLGLFSQIMGLDYWLECSTKAAKQSRYLESAMRDLEDQILLNENELIILAKDIEELTNKENSFEDDKLKTIAGISSDLKRAVKNLEDHEFEQNKLEIELKHSTKELCREQIKIDKKLEERSSLGDEQNELEWKYKSEIKDLNSAKATLEKFTNLGAKCPTCGQNVDAKHTKQEIYLIKSLIETIQANMAKITEDLEVCKKSREAFRNETVELSTRRDKISRRVNEIQRDINFRTADITESKTQITNRKNSILKTKEMKNPYTAMIAEKKSRITTLKALAKTNEKAFAEERANFEATSWWVAGFKRLRLFLIEETLRSLELEVNSSLNSLGLIDWLVEFDVERENKSGGVTKGFVVLIQSPGNSDPVKFETWSGGEGQRLQLAGDLGLANLIMNKAGLSNAVEFYDEPSKHLSRSGLLDLAETLHQRAVNEGRRIFLIDHHTLEFGEFAGTYTVVKTKEGSEIVS